MAADAAPAVLLAPIREHMQAAEAGGLAEWSDGYIPSALYRSCRTLTAAVEAALAFHEEFDGHCGSCCDAYGDPVEWPCEEFTDITAALTTAL